jgi:hypothetical protein
LVAVQVHLIQETVKQAVLVAEQVVFQHLQQGLEQVVKVMLVELRLLTLEQVAAAELALLAEMQAEQTAVMAVLVLHLVLLAQA